jgi:hypothetical protein
MNTLDPGGGEFLRMAERYRVCKYSGIKDLRVFHRKELRDPLPSHIVASAGSASVLALTGCL